MPVTLTLSLPHGRPTQRRIYAPNILTLAEAVRAYAAERGVSALAVSWSVAKGA